MAALDRNAARALMERDGLNEEQLANLAGVSVSHVKRVLDCREFPSAALARVIHAQGAPVASIAPPSPITAALAVVQETMQREADKSRDTARAVTAAANAYARTVEESIAHAMLASVGRSSGPAPNVQAAALELVSCVQQIPEIASLFASPTPAPASLPVDPPVVVPADKHEPETVEAPPFNDEAIEALPSNDETIEAPSQPAPLKWPLLARATARRPIAIVGGQPIPATVEWLRGEGLVVEWDEVAKIGSDRVVQSLARRVAHGSLAALVFVQGFLQHKHCEALRKAAIEAKLSFAFAGTGGKAGMRSALDKLEAAARERRAA